MTVVASDTFASSFAGFWTTQSRASIVSGRGRLVCSTSFDGNLGTATSYPLAGATWTVEVPTVPVQAGGGVYWWFEAIVALDRFGDLDTGLTMTQFGNANLTFRETVSGAQSDTTVTYNATTHRWLRLRMDTTNVYFETSPDGSTWTTRRTLATRVDLTRSAAVGIGTGYASSAPSPLYLEVDNFSIDDGRSSAAAPRRMLLLGVG